MLAKVVRRYLEDPFLLDAAPAAPAAPNRRLTGWLLILPMPLPDGNPGWLHRPLTSLRPWAWAALLLLVCEGLLRIFLPPDPRVLRQPLRAQACFADDA